MPIFILVRGLVLLVCIKSALFMSFPARTMNKTPHKSGAKIMPAYSPLNIKVKKADK